jgi:hypothetical protein
MKIKMKFAPLSIIIVLISGCVPAPSPQMTTPPLLGTEIGGSRQNSNEYGRKPSSYRSAIQAYFSSNILHGKEGQFQFSEPKRAYKRKGYAYGGEVAWRGWMVDATVATQSRTGRWRSAKPYMVLFSGEQVVDTILGNSHKLLIKVDK